MPAVARERPIVCTAAEVRGILDGSRTTLRRPVKLAKGRPPGVELACLAGNRAAPLRDGIGLVWTPHAGAVEQPMPPDRVMEFSPWGTRLWVRETWSPDHRYFYSCSPAVYRADDPVEIEGAGRVYRPEADAWFAFRWRPSIHMPRWASRITLELTGVRVERAGETTEDVAAEDVGKWFWVLTFKRIEES